MKKIFQFAIAALMLLPFNACTLDLEPMPEEEKVDLEKVGFDAPYTYDMEDKGSITYQYADSTRILVKEAFDYLIDVEDDTILYFSDDIPKKLLIQPGYYVVKGCCLELPQGLENKVTKLEHLESGMYRMVTTYANHTDVYEVYSVHFESNITLSDNYSSNDDEEDSIPSPAGVRRKSAAEKGSYHVYDWGLYGDPLPTSERSPYSQQARRRYLKQKAKHTRAGKTEEKEIFNFHLRPSKKEASYSVLGIASGTFDTDLFKTTYDGFALDIEVKQVVDKYVVWDDEAFKKSNGAEKAVLRETDQSTWKFNVKGEYSGDLKISDKLEDFFKKHDGKLKPKDGVFKAHTLRLPVGGPVPLNAFFRYKPGLDFKLGVKGEVDFEYKCAPTTKVTVYKKNRKGEWEQDSDPEDEAPKANKKGLKFNSISLGGFFQMNFNCEALVGLDFGASGFGGAGLGVGVYLDLDFTASLMGTFGINDATEKYGFNINNDCMKLSLGATGRASLIAEAGGEDWINAHLDTKRINIFPEKKWYFYPHFYNKVGSFEKKELKDQYPSVLTGRFSCDDTGMLYIKNRAESERRPAMKIYRDKELTDLYKLVILDDRVFGEGEFVLRTELDTPQPGTYYGVPCYHYIWYDQWEKKNVERCEEFPSEVFEFEEEKRPYIEVVGAQQLSGIDYAPGWTYEVQFQFNVLNPTLIPKYWTGGMLLASVIDRKNKDGEWEEIDETYITDELLGEKIAEANINKCNYNIVFRTGSKKEEQYRMRIALAHASADGKWLTHYIDSDGKQNYKRPTDAEREAGFCTTTVILESTHGERYPGRSSGTTMGDKLY